MAGPSVTYTFANSTTADATQVNQNFTDIINGVTDGTKDLSINALTVAGSITANGNVTLGNASGDDITITGSLAGTVLIKTNASFNFGDSTHGFAGVYLGNSTFTTKLATAATASYTFKYPATAGSTNQIPYNTDGAATMGWMDVDPARNRLFNGSMEFWERLSAPATGTTLANAAVGYVCDRWACRNVLGTNGVITVKRVAGSVTGSPYGQSVQITTAPTAAQTNGCEIVQYLENLDTMPLYNQTASFSIQVKALGNVTQVGVVFVYNTTEAFGTPSTIGSEVLTSVTTGGFALCSISGQALGTSMTTSGIVGVRIRITAVSSGNTYDLNNGYILEQGQLNLGATPASYRRQNVTATAELQACQRYCEVMGYGCIGEWVSATDIKIGGNYKVKKRAAPSTGGVVITSVTIEELGVGSHSAVPSATSIAGGIYGAKLNATIAAAGATAGKGACGLTDFIFYVDSEIL